MDKRDIMSRQTIGFPRELSLGETRELLWYIGKKLPANIHYWSGQHTDLFYGPSETGGLQRIDDTSSLGGVICHRDKPIALDSFGCPCSSSGDTSKLVALRFQFMPGWNLQKYGSERQQLWDNTRACVEAYFAENPLPELEGSKRS